MTTEYWTTEYWLQKKTIGGWSMVTWYSELEQASKNYDQLRKNIGYSYRMAEVKIVQEHLLDEVVKVEAPEVELDAKANVWGGQQKPQATGGWTKPEQQTNNGWNTLEIKTKLSSIDTTNNPWGKDDRGDLAEPKEHGLTGSVWVIHHANKHKCRVSANDIDDMLAKGYERGGPRTQFR